MWSGQCQNFFLPESRREQAFDEANRRIDLRDHSASTSTSTSDRDGAVAPTDTLTSYTIRSAAGSSSSTGYGCSTTDGMASETAPPRVDEDPDEASPWRSTGTSDEPSSSSWHDSYWDSSQSNWWWTRASTESWREPDERFHSEYPSFIQITDTDFGCVSR